MNITMQILGVESNSQNSLKHLEGDIINIYPSITEAPSPNSSLVFVHVNNVPITDLKKKSFLKDSKEDEDENIIFRHLWKFDSSLTSPENIAYLTEHRQITIEWSRAKEIIKNKETNEFLSEGDING